MSISDDNLDPSPIPSKTSTALAGGKRKREHAANAAADVLNNGDQMGTHTEQLQQLLRDTVELLKSNDIAPSILHHTIPPPSTDTPVAKRPKLAASTDTTSIARLVESDAYTTIDDLSKDLEAVTASVIEEMEGKASGGKDDGRTKIRAEPHPDIVQAIAFKQEFNHIILRELLQRPYLTDQAERKNRPSTTGDGTPGTPPLGFGIGNDPNNRSYSTILTLFGGSGQPKQLFSSLKKYSSQPTPDIDDLKSRVNEMGLPNGINFTKVVPVHSKGSREGTNEIPTIKELFAPPSSMQSLNPPRQSRHTATRSSSVNWYNPSEATTPSRPNRRDSYSQQPLTTGQWLTYNIPPSTKDMSSPDSKRKQRDRALSFGEPQNEPSEQLIALHRYAKEDALFRSVYSGFAPDRDNTGALVPEPSKNRLWWKRVGERRYNDSILWSRQETSYEDDNHLSNGDIGMGENIQEVSLSEAVETWAPEETPTEFSDGKQQAENEDSTANGTDGILGEISQLLETLDSYQEVRNLTLPTNARTSASQNPQLSAMTGTPTSPSSDELDIYNMLKLQLSMMVSSLPPYAFAKLDGQKLGKLGVNTKIQVETPNYQGSLEEDEISTRGRLPAVNVTAGYPSRTPSAAVGLAPRNNYLAATSTPAALSHRPGHMPQTMPTRSTAAPSYLPNQQYSTRPPSATQYYANNARSSYPSQRAMSSSTPDRYSYSASQQYGQQSARQSYVNGYNQYPNQNGTAYGQGYAHSQQPSASTRISQPSYQQSARLPQSYSYAPTPTPSGGSASPSKAAMQSTSQGHTHQSSTPSQPRPQLYQQHSSQTNPQTPSSPQVNGTSSPQGPQLNSEQVVSMNRQKAQLAEAARANSSTPQPANASQMEGGQRNGTTTGQPNGARAAQNELYELLKTDGA
ncbi:MAG: hypothetical protein Q9225_006189 [Loekoesia sp. 1 TL-2023]